MNKARTLIALVNGNFVAFFEKKDKDKAIQLRKSDRRMKYARIIETIQMKPSVIELGEVYPRR